MARKTVRDAPARVEVRLREPTFHLPTSCDSIKGMLEPVANFAGLRVASFESRRAEEMARLIEKLGGEAFVSPSMREVPLADHSAAVDFGHRLITGMVDIAIMQTGVGFTYLLSALERHLPRERLVGALADIVTVARGPKVVAAMREVGLRPTYLVPEPNTWRETLEILDQHRSIANQTVGLQEYGELNPSLLAGLEARGARVIRVPVYRWDFPEDTRLLEENVRALCSGAREVALYTSAHQVHQLLEKATELQLTAELRRAWQRCVVGSVGPSTSEALRDAGIPVDIEPEHARMGTLVVAAATRCHAILTRKEQIKILLDQPVSTDPDDAPWMDSLFMKACRCEPTARTPVWLMRQAGRYLPEYRELRSRVAFLDLCKSPELCAEIMVRTVQRLKVDAAIIFADLLPMLEPMGADLEYSAGEGPIIHNPVRESADVNRVAELENIDALHFTIETVRRTRADLPNQIPLIGFAGAPFTLASYLIEGGASRHFLHTKTLMLRDPGAWQALMERLVRAITLYLNAQIAAGAQCVQLFDSWVGCLGPDEYHRYVLPHMRQLLAGIKPGAPVISFSTGNPALLPELAAADCQVVGVDWRVRLDQAWEAIGYGHAIQGNLDPTILFADAATIRKSVHNILRQAAGRAGHIFNLGHGVLPQTPVDHVQLLVETVRELSSRGTNSP